MVNERKTEKAFADPVTFGRFLARIAPNDMPDRFRRWLADTYPIEPYVAVEELCHHIHEARVEMPVDARLELYDFAIKHGLDSAQIAVLVGVDATPQ